jgi:hypothetical protein
MGNVENYIQFFFSESYLCSPELLFINTAQANNIRYTFIFHLAGGWSICSVWTVGYSD